ncbi:uncharacterized protein lipeb isoform X2 [Mobula hypostoma]|uniref:uncharacterized protein lipeb isoform X2 n=1 Tax=Mobula hypostoma TaxID=723540 RepID=UPI002FC395BE
MPDRSPGSRGPSGSYARAAASPASDNALFRSVKVERGVQCILRPGMTLEKCTEAMEDLVGKGGILATEEEFGKAVFYLVNEELVHRALSRGVTVDNIFLPMELVTAPTQRIVLGHVKPFIPNEDLLPPLARLGQVRSEITAIRHKFKRRTLRTLISFRRQVFMQLEREDDVEGRFTVRHEGVDYQVYWSSERPRCHACREVGHFRRDCPAARNPREPTSGTSAAATSAPDPTPARAPAPASDPAPARDPAPAPHPAPTPVPTSTVGSVPAPLPVVQVGDGVESVRSKKAKGKSKHSKKRAFEAAELTPISSEVERGARGGAQADGAMETEGAAPSVKPAPVCSSSVKRRRERSRKRAGDVDAGESQEGVGIRVGVGSKPESSDVATSPAVDGVVVQKACDRPVCTNEAALEASTQDLQVSASLEASVPNSVRGDEAKLSHSQHQAAYESLGPKVPGSPLCLPPREDDILCTSTPAINDLQGVPGDCLSAVANVDEADATVEQAGSTGERICLAGDSAGGNLCITVCMQAASYGVRLPDGIMAAYPATLLQATASPSRLLTFIDPLLPLSVLSKCLSAYAGLEPAANSSSSSSSCTSCTPDKVDPLSAVRNDTAMILREIRLGASAWINSLLETRRVGGRPDALRKSCSEAALSRPCTSGSLLDSQHDYVMSRTCEEESSPSSSEGELAAGVVDGSSGAGPDLKLGAEDEEEEWTTGASKFPKGFQPLRSGSGNIELRTSAIESNPFMSPLLAPDHMLKGLPPVHLVACALDPMLDDAVMFARRLRAVGQPVSLRVIDDLPHGFLSLAPLCRETRDASRLCVEKIREVLQDQSRPPGHEADRLRDGALEDR